MIAGGGKAANVAVVARRLGLPALLLTHIGDDALAEIALELQRTLGTDVSGTRRVVGQSTGVSQIWVAPDGEQQIVLAPNANDACTAEDIDVVAETIVGAPTASVLMGRLRSPSVRGAGGRRGGPPGRPPGRAGPFARRSRPAEPRRCTFLTLNPSEAAQLTGIEVRSPAEAERAGRALLERGVQVAMVKLSGGGCVVVARDLTQHLTARPVTVVDTTGGGEAFAGALGGRRPGGRGPLAAARLAVAVASQAVSRYGSQPAYPSRAEVERLLASS